MRLPFFGVAGAAARGAMLANPWIAVPLAAIKAAWGFLRSLPWWVWLVLALAIAGWRWGEHTADVREAEVRAEYAPKVKALEDKVAQQAANIGTLKEAVAKQNRAIDDLKKRGDTGEANASAAAETVIKAGAARRRTIQASTGSGPQEMNQWMSEAFTASPAEPSRP